MRLGRRAGVLLSVTAVVVAAAVVAAIVASTRLTASPVRPRGPAASGAPAGASPSPGATGNLDVPTTPAQRARVGGRRLASKGIVVDYPAHDARRLPKVPASAYVIADAGTGQVLAAKDPHGEFGPASTLKVLTAITLIPLLSPSALVTASRRAVSAVPSIVGLRQGRTYRVADLFRALLMISANDAAVALLQAAAGGSYQRGIALLNAQARHLQAYDVIAKTPNGLPAPGQVTSAYDEALIARQALKMRAFMRYDQTLTARFRDSKFDAKKRHWITIANQNSLLTGYRGGIGGKIGWTRSSKATYVGLARRHGVTLIVTILHCKPLYEILTAEKLLNWGFAMDGKVKPVGALVTPLR